MNGANGRNTARRRRADTIARCERIMETARRLPLTRDVLAEAIERATPAQLDLMEGWLDAEIESRERSKRARLLKAAGFPNAKDIEGYDWSNLRMPADWGRAQLETLDFVDRCEDLVLYGPVGTGKTHLAVALGRYRVHARDTCQVLHRDRAAYDAAPRETGRPARHGAPADRQGEAPDHRRVRLHAGRRGGLQAPVPGHIGFLRDPECHLHHEHRVLRLGARARRQEHGRRVDRPHRAPRKARQIRGRLLPQRARPHDQITKEKGAAGSDGAVPAGNQPPMLPKNSAYTVDANLQKHSQRLFAGQRRRGGVLRAYEDEVRLSRALGGAYP